MKLTDIVKTVVIAALAVGCLAGVAVAEVGSDQSRKRLDDLFRWRVSDTLQLDTKQDVQFTKVLGRVHEKRRKAGDEMTRIVSDISKTENKKQIESFIVQYEKQLKIYGETQAEELNELKKVFGTEKLGKYLVFKNDLGRKLKTALSSPQSTPSASANAAVPGSAQPTGQAVDVSPNSGTSKDKIPDPSIIDNE